MTKIKDLPKHKRPREKLSEKGAENLTDAELLAILIRTGRAGKSALDIARETLKKYPISRLLTVTKDELIGIKGLEDTKAITVKAALELGSRAVGSFNDSLPVLDSVKTTVAQLADLRGKQKEYFKTLYLNARNQLIHKETISIGTLTQTLVHPREVFEPAIRHIASSIVLAHNHPSKNTEVSDEDIKLTEKLIQSGTILDIEVLDHIIITDDGYISLKEKGLLFK
ncbi:DNA repair protein RadC [Patescibacteria group bacterium]|nr:DNA repair protein RadC [Patescibacteria group bacterium]MCG2702176.1 DNA repair protein RadC [Candidatus Parcubacteria bacterium]MBU4265340.1 DNA repair protein RadC [Patescibacteria group bacterium]MBU4390780.1 DNA repair protein RadC [Patescibacteria group bacterium]MBU4431500.1 DNA repair protein RadC [Patescibacteria group bacterium]